MGVRSLKQLSTNQIVTKDKTSQCYRKRGLTVTVFFLY